ncbi:MAG TPA: hypothetical protein VFY04_03295 [Solirubrobacterales bacterium]|nr:hypothetical protein [Solirubrobacterales bacterium]
MGVPRQLVSSISEFFNGPEPEVPPAESFLPPRLAAALVGGDPLHPTVYATLTAHDRVSGRRLYAAALRDLADLEWDQVASACGIEGIDPERQARAYAERGRGLWYKLGGWPWYHLPEHWQPKSREQWWLNPRVTSALAIWLGEVTTRP